MTGCICNRASQTFNTDTISLDEVSNYYLFIRPNLKTGEEIYKSDLSFVMECAKKENKSFFLFDGTLYPTDETAFQQMDALIKARQAGKKKFKFNGKEKEACSFYAPSEQIKIFGNLWEEVISPQSKTTKILLEQYAKQIAPFQELSPFVLDRLYQLCRVSGYPEIKDARKDNSLIGSVVSGARGHLNSYYSPAFIGRSTIYLEPDSQNKDVNYDDIISELPHAFRDNNNTFGEIAQFLSDGIKDIITFNSLGFGNDAQIKNYKNPNRMEYDAHKVVQPIIRKYLLSPKMSLTDVYHEIEKIRSESKNTYSLTSKAKKELQGQQTKKEDLTVSIFGYKRNITER